MLHQKYSPIIWLKYIEIHDLLIQMEYCLIMNHHTEVKLVTRKTTKGSTNCPWNSIKLTLGNLKQAETGALPVTAEGMYLTCNMMYLKIGLK